jgi:hypothetical protein
VLDVGIPFGGVKQSGYGRELGREGLDAFFETHPVFLDGEPFVGLSLMLNTSEVKNVFVDKCAQDKFGRAHRSPRGRRNPVEKSGATRWLS